MTLENIHTIWENLEPWQKVTVISFMLVWATLIIVYVKSKTAQHQNDDSILDKSVLSKENLKIFGMAIFIMLVIFGVIAFIFF